MDEILEKKNFELVTSTFSFPKCYKQNQL